MNRRASLTICCAVVFGASVVVRGQIIMQPTHPPIATAENESWYVSGEPITHEGYFYYRVGAQVHFNANEMVRSGFYRGIALYARTTLEPFSIVFVPLPGGLMQPYERRRAGDVAGTSGSTTSLLPMEIAAQKRTATWIPQAPSPPTSVASGIPEAIIGVFPAPTEAEPTLRPTVAGGAASETVGSSGRITAAPMFPLVQSGEKPSGVNAIFIEFQNARWYTRGGPMSLDAQPFVRVGEYHGFPVYALDGQKDVIYIPTTKDISSLVVPYSTRRER